MAHAGCSGRLRLPDRNDQFRTALVARLFPHSAFAGESLGTRCVRVRGGRPKSVVGHRSALCRRYSRLGTNRVLCVGAVFYALGLVIMAHSSTPEELSLSAGVLIGLGLSGCSFNIVLGAFGKLLPEKWRSLAFGAGTAAGSFGQFLYWPFAVALFDYFDWLRVLLIF